MKYFFIVLGILCLIAINILYFQMIVSVSTQVPFFRSYIPIKLFILYFVFLAMGCGVFLTLGIKGILSSSSRIDDDFDL